MVNIGIDCGTTNSCVGILEHGNVEIISNNYGQRKTPSIISFINSTHVVGHVLDKNIKNIKQFLTSHLKTNPFLIEPHQFQIEFENLSRVFSTQELLSFIIQHLKTLVEEDTKQKVNCTTLAIPNDFQDTHLLKEACQLANLDATFIRSAFAAVTAYSLDNCNVLVFHMGGYTTDVSIVQVQSGQMSLIAHRHEKIGGNTLDEKVSKETKHLLSYTEKTNEMTRQEFEEINSEFFQTIDTLIKDTISDYTFDCVIPTGGSTRIPKIRNLLKQFNKPVHTIINPDEVITYGATLKRILEN